MAEGKRQVRKIPEATVTRLPIYLRSLLEAAGDGTPTISSERLAELSGFNAAKVRKDLSYLGSYGTRGVGYDVEYLVFQMSRELGLTQEWHVVIAGLGNLGHALANYGGFTERGFPVAALVDADPKVVGTDINGITVRHIDELDAIAAEHQVAIGIIATPASAAQEVADRMIAAGRQLDPQLRPHHRDRAARGVAAEGRPGRRAADPQLLPAAPGRRPPGRRRCRGRPAGVPPIR